MKRSIPIMIVLIITIAGFACTGNRAEISGHVNGGEGLKLTLERLDVNQTSLVDSLNIGEDGTFAIKLELEEPELYILKNPKGEIINLLLMPGDKISVESNYESFGHDYMVSGSDESEGIRNLVEHLQSTRKDLDSLQVIAGSIGDPENPQMKLVRSAFSQAIIKQKRYTIKYLVEHMGSPSSVYALYQKYNDGDMVLNLEGDLQYFKAVADSLEVTYPNSSLTKSLRADITQREADFTKAEKLNNLLAMADEEISGMLELSIADRDGKKIELSSLRGKVTLVAFWASGNKESIKALLQLKPIYNKYHEKGFEVYAISLDNNKVNWMTAIDFNEFDWINVSELSFPESKAALLYNVTSLPTTYLINREGDILAKDLYGRTLETWLDNLI